MKYYINLVLVDEEDRRYFKQQEIIFWRCNENQNVQILGVGTGAGVGIGGGGGNIKNSFLPSTYHMTVDNKKVTSVHTNDTATATDHIKV